MIFYAINIFCCFAAQSIWEIGNKKDNPHDFAMAVDASELEAFGFTDDFIFDLWGSINDAKSGRLNKQQDFSQNFWNSDELNATKSKKNNKKKTVDRSKDWIKPSYFLIFCFTFI